MESGSAATQASSGEATERRIAWLTPLFGVTAAIIAAALRQRAWALGLLIGTLLASLNFRWLRKGMDAFAAGSAAQTGAEKPQPPAGTYARVMLRYVLIAVCLYVSFEYLGIPLVSMIAGLCALGAAGIAASVYEVFHAGQAGR